MMKMRGSIIWGFLVLIVCAGYTQAEVEKEALPIIEIEMPTYDFGRAPQGEVVKHDFRVFNRGAAPLDIKSVKPG
jgi:acetamidase/formamidase